MPCQVSFAQLVLTAPSHLFSTQRLSLTRHDTTRTSSLTLLSPARHVTAFHSSLHSLRLTLSTGLTKKQRGASGPQTLQQGERVTEHPSTRVVLTTDLRSSGDTTTRPLRQNRSPPSLPPLRQLPSPSVSSHPSPRRRSSHPRTSSTLLEGGMTWAGCPSRCTGEHLRTTEGELREGS